MREAWTDNFALFYQTLNEQISLEAIVCSIIRMTISETIGNPTKNSRIGDEQMWVVEAIFFFTLPKLGRAIRKTDKCDRWKCDGRVTDHPWKFYVKRNRWRKFNGNYVIGSSIE